MSADSSNIPDNLRQKFPNLRPLKGPPSLMTMNGIGAGMYGKRDYDAETQTYVKTRCFCLIFVPLFALGAYRVADAGSRSWYFIGREPLSGFARSWNILACGLLVLLGLGVTWNIHTSSPQYRAHQEIKRAAELRQSGKNLQAAAIYRQQIAGPAAAEARLGLKDTVEWCLQSDQPQTAAGALRLIAGLPDTPDRAEVLADPLDRGLSLVEKFRATNPDGALDILKETAAFEPKNPKLAPLRIDLLKQIVAAQPDSTNRVVELAVAYESAGQLDECLKLLRPYQHKLGDTEGARILGQKMLQEGNYTDAYELLSAYVQPRLGRLPAIEASYTNALHLVRNRAFDELQHGRAGQDFYTRYDAASKAEQEAMVDRFLETRMKADPTVQRSLLALKDANQIVTVALDLGIVQLNRAQGLKDPAARKSELEAAEKTFLAIRSFAGEDDDYKMFLGQVYYWLGRSKEGKELFDQLLAGNQRAYSTLMSLSHTLRSVGETADARALAEEAYKKGKSNEEKYPAAWLRSLLYKDDDDQIAWLEKSDPDSSWIQIELNSARGKKTLQQGNKTLAADYLRKAISGYESQRKTPASLNNCGLAYFDLYEATGNIEDHKRGMALLEEAITMSPSDSILLQNTTYHLFARAVMDVIQDSIHVEALGEHANTQMMAHLYQNEAQRAPLYQRLRDNEAMKKAMGYLDKALLLAPKDAGLYSTALGLHASFHDLSELQKLEQRLRIAAPDLSEVRQETLQSYSGVKDKDYLEKIQARIKTLEDLARNPAVNGHALTLEEVTISLLGLKEQLPRRGGTADSRALLQTALAAYQKHPCSATRHALKSAYCFRACDELAQQNPQFGALVQSTRRSLDSEEVITFVLERGGPMSEQARRNQNVVQAVALQKEIVANFPNWVNISEWAMLRTADPALAADLARKLADNEAARLADQLQFRLNPVNASAVLEQFWTQRMLGDEKRAAEIHQAAVREGVPLPQL
jgi:hypothetical protein